MFENYYDINSYSENYSVEDWNNLIRDIFYKYFSEESDFLRTKDILRFEVINYLSLSTNKEYLQLFEDSIEYFNILKKKSYTDFENVFLEHFEKTHETDLRWANLALTQSDISQYSTRDKTEIEFKAIEDILEGCFKERFKLLFHVEKAIENITYENNWDFGNYVTAFNNSFKKFNLFKEDPIHKIKISQWRNIAAHKNYQVRKENILVKYGKGSSIKESQISYLEFESIFLWIKSAYSALRLAEVITFIGNRSILKKVNENNYEKRLRFEQWTLSIIHNLQIVGFPFVKTIKDENCFSIILKKKYNADLEESIIHASQSLDQLSMSIYNDDFVRDKFQIAKVVIVSDSLEELASAYVNVKELNDDNHRKELLDCVKFKIGDKQF